MQDPVAAAKLLVDHALAKFSTDNLSCMIVRLDKQALLENQNNKDRAIGVEGDAGTGTASGHTGISETEKILKSTQASIADGRSSPVGVSASNSGKGHDLSGHPTSVPASAPVTGDGENQTGFVPTLIEGSVEEEPAAISGIDDLRVSPEAAAPPRDCVRGGT